MEENKNIEEFEEVSVENENVQNETEGFNNPIPINVTIEKFKNAIVDTINSSELHISITEMILKDIYMEVRNVSERQLAEDMKKFQ